MGGGERRVKSIGRRRRLFLGPGGGSGGARWGRPGRRSMRLPCRLPSDGDGRCPFRLGRGGFLTATIIKVPRPIKNSLRFRGEEVKETAREVKTAPRASRALGRQSTSRH